MKVKNVFTGSCETEAQLRIFLNHAVSLVSGVKRDIFTDEYMFKVMTLGRNGKGEVFEGSQAHDDTGGYFIQHDGKVFLSEKAKNCIST